MTESIDDVSAELRRGVTRLYSRFRAERVDGEVPDAALLVLLALDKTGPRSLTELAEHARVTLGSMSQTVRRLEADGLVAKTRDTVDRRRVIFSLTPDGQAAVTASREHRRDWLRSRLAELDASDLADVLRASRILLRIADS